MMNAQDHTEECNTMTDVVLGGSPEVEKWR